MPSCYWPGCTYGRKKRKWEDKTKEVKKLHLFRGPQDIKLLEEWKKVIPRGKKEFTSKSQICSFHFKEGDVLKYFQNKCPDGSTWILERERASLKEGAIPCIPPPKRDTQDQEYILPTVDVIIEEDDNLQEIEKFDSPIVDYLDLQPDEHSNSFSLNDIKWKRQQLIQNSSWTTTVSDEFVGFLFWDSNFRIQKHVLIFKDLKIKVFFNNKESKMFKNITVESLQRLSVILHLVEDQRDDLILLSSHFISPLMKK